MWINVAHRLTRARYRMQGFESRSLELDWTRLAYLEHRPRHARRAILFLHGLGTSSSSWMQVAPHFRPETDLFLPDLPGYGYSELGPSLPFADLARLRSALDTLVENVLPERFILIGHSLGGWLAADLALRHQPRVSELILINTTGVLYPGVERQRDLFSVDSVEKTRLLMNHLWLSFPWYFRPFIPSIFRELKRRRVTDFVNSVRAEDMLNERISALKIPVSLVWGKDDALIGHETISILQRLLPGLTVRMIDRCGHIPQLERPHALTAVLRQLLEDEIRPPVKSPGI